MGFYENLGQYTPDKLIAGTKVPRLLEGIIIESGQGELKRGSLLGKVTETGKFKLVDEKATDGSEKPLIILADDIDATKEIKTIGYISGEFNKQAIYVAEGTDINKFEIELRKLGIYLVKVI